MLITRCVDASVIYQLHTAIFLPPALSINHIESILGQGVALVAMEQERPCGYALWQCAMDSADLVSVGVVADMQQQGLGYGLLKESATMLKKQGIKEGFLEVSTENCAVVTLYIKAGFMAIDQRRKYYANGDDAVVMRQLL